MHKQTKRAIIHAIFCFLIGFLSSNPSFSQKKAVPPKKEVLPAKKTTAKTTTKTTGKTPAKKQGEPKKTVIPKKETKSQKETKSEKNGKDLKKETPPLNKLEVKSTEKNNPIEDVKSTFNQIMHYSIPDSTKAFAHQLFHRKDRDTIYYSERDIVDLIFVKSEKGRNERSNKKVFFTFFPGAGISPSSSIFITLISNFAFYTGSPKNTYLSSVDFTPVLSFKNEIFLPLKSNIWTKRNKYNVITDWRFSNYPEYTYGLGGGTEPEDRSLINLSYIKLHQSIQQKIHQYWFAGVGYHYDNHYNIKQVAKYSDSISGFERYQSAKQNTVSSGIIFNLQSNTRRNTINPTGGHYFSTTYRVNTGLLGSNSNWQSIYADYRRYFQLNKTNPNILAFNTLVWLTLGDNVPYFDLPTLAGDVYGRTGRGYGYGRYRGQYMLYFESEYRFRLMQNGLLGSVVFMNLSSFSEPVTNNFVYILPAFGSGLRLKLDKRSKANLAVDLGLGLHGSWEIRFNIGEVF